MISKRIVIVSGPPGSGKSSISNGLAENSVYDKVVNMNTDDFYHYISKGYISPWLPESHEQNNVIIEALAASAARLADGGYEIIVDGIVGPWFLGPWLKLSKSGFDVRYIILRPDEQTTITRAINRNKDRALTDADVVGNIWHGFSNLGNYESYIIDTTKLTIEETIIKIQKLLDANAMRIV